MSFFRDLFGASADKDKIHQRLWPEAVGDMADPSPENLLAQGIIYSRVFRLTDTDHRRKYDREYVYLYAQMSHEGEPLTEIEAISYSKGSRAPMRRYDTTKTLAELVARMVEFEKNMIAYGNEVVAGSTRNFHLAASKAGLHVDEKNNVIPIDAMAPVLRPLQMEATSKKILYGPSANLPPLSTWEGFYARYVTPLLDKSNPLNTVLPQHRDYKHMRGFVRGDVDRLRAIAKGCCDKGLFAKITTQDLRMFEQRRQAYDRYDDWGDRIEGSEAHKHWQRIFDISMLVAMLQTGANVVENMPDVTGHKINEEKIGILYALRFYVRRMLDEQFGINGEAAGQITDIMLKGANPHGPELPVQTYMAQYPVPPKPPRKPAVKDLPM